MASTFLEYMDKVGRDAIHELKVVKRILKVAGFQVESHLHAKDDDPFLFVYSQSESPNFGLRIYKLGGKDIYYRPQKAPNKHPWGEAKTLDIKGIFEDVTSDEQDDDKAAEQIIKAVADDIKGFFKLNAKAEKKHKKGLADNSPLGAVAVRANLDVGDYSNVTYGTNR